jgi:hypothetical protein
VPGAIYLWRAMEPTEKQMFFLREHGHYCPVANRREASDLVPPKGA